MGWAFDHRKGSQSIEIIEDQRRQRQSKLPGLLDQMSECRGAFRRRTHVDSRISEYPGGAAGRPVASLVWLAVMIGDGAHEARTSKEDATVVTYAGV